MKVTVANGERVPCPSMYRATAFSIDGETFSTDFFALPLAGYDVVLGTHWLHPSGQSFGILERSPCSILHSVIYNLVKPIVGVDLSCIAIL